jgi:hypothetical protein
MGPLSATRLRSSPRRSHLGGNDSPPRSPSSSRAARVRELDAEVEGLRRSVPPRARPLAQYCLHHEPPKERWSSQRAKRRRASPSSPDRGRPSGV